MSCTLGKRTASWLGCSAHSHRTFLPLRKESGRSLTDFFASLGAGVAAGVAATWRVMVLVPMSLLLVSIVAACSISLVLTRSCSVWVQTIAHSFYQQLKNIYLCNSTRCTSPDAAHRL